MLINGSGYSFSIVAVTRWLVVVGGGGQCSVESMGTQAFQNYCSKVMPKVFNASYLLVSFRTSS